MSERRQMLAFLPQKLRNSSTREEDLHAIVETYAYSKIAAKWDGQYEGRPGLFFVLDGHPLYGNQATIDRLASGLHFAHVLYSNFLR